VRPKSTQGYDGRKALRNDTTKRIGFDILFLLRFLASPWLGFVKYMISSMPGSARSEAGIFLKRNDLSAGKPECP
jgi:hypothetical protein